MPVGKITPGAKKVHGWTKKKLMEKGAKQFTKADSEKLATFLMKYPNLPIVAHNVQHDLDEVLMPAFDNVNNLERLPEAKRWRCTLEMSRQVPFLKFHGLDDLLEHFGFERRSLEVKHDAQADCILTAKVYMEIMKISVKQQPSLGFVKK